MYPDLPLPRPHSVGPLAEDAEPHVLQHGYGLRQGDGLARRVEPDVDAVRCLQYGPVEVQAEVAAASRGLDPRNVERGGARLHLLPEAARKGVPVVPEQAHARRLPVLLGQGHPQHVAPAERRLPHTLLQLVHLEALEAAFRCVDDVVNAGQDRLGEERRELHLRPLDGGDQHLLYPQPQVPVVLLPGQVDEEGVETVEVVPEDEQFRPLALLQAEHPHGDVEQLLRGDLEQGVAREVVQDVVQHLAGVAERGQAGPDHHLHHLLAQQGNVARRTAVSGAGEQADDTVDAGAPAPAVAAPDGHEVEVGGAVHGRACVGLGHQQVAGEVGVGVVQERHDLLQGVLGIAPLFVDAQHRLAVDHQHLAAVSRLQLQLAVAQKGEVAVHHPVDEGVGLGQFVGVHQPLELLGAVAQGDHSGPHGFPVGIGANDVAQHAVDHGVQAVEDALLQLLVDLELDHRHRFAGAARRGLNRPYAPVVVPLHPDDRVQRQLDGEAEPVQSHRQGVDEKGEVLVDDLDDGVRTLPAVLFEVGVVDPDRRASGPVPLQQLPVGDDRTHQVGDALCLEVGRGNVPVVEAQQGLDLAATGRVESSRFQPFELAEQAVQELFAVRSLHQTGPVFAWRGTLAAPLLRPAAGTRRHRP